ncbi:MAG TPA: pseudouridine synthase [Patescibacteria group bacterium]
MTIERIDKFLANQGLASRRTIKRLLKEFEIAINGKRVKKSGERFNPDIDTLTINGKKIEKKDFVYYILNKPKGVISTTSDEIGREDVTMYIDTQIKIYPVGRLDKDTHGLLLLTNDGDLTHKLIHPKFHIPKVYLLTIAGRPLLEQIERFKKGVLLSDGPTLPTEVKIKKETDTETILEVTLFEGKYRQIRRMCKTLSLELLDLQRIQFGPLKIGKMPEGSYKELTEKQIEELRIIANKN